MCVDPRWFSIIGLILDVIGAAILASGLIVDKGKISGLIKAYKGLPSSNEKENLKSAFAKHFFKQSNRAKIGVVLLVVGFILQIVGNF